MAKTAQQPVLVIMGVSGSGKSTVAGLVAGRLGWDLAEGDDLHPASNVAKMQAGEPLTDEDRWPWLETIAEWIRAHTQDGTPGVITCSALKKALPRRPPRRGRGVCLPAGKQGQDLGPLGVAARALHAAGPARIAVRGTGSAHRGRKLHLPVRLGHAVRKRPRKSSTGSIWTRQTPRRREYRDHALRNIH